MIHMSQVKVPLERILKEVPADLVKSGRIGSREEELVKEFAAHKLRIQKKQIQLFQIIKKSIDARRKGAISFIYQVSFSVSGEEKYVRQYGKPDVKRVPARQEARKKENTVHWKEQQIVIVGFGPAGMFAALTLARAGLSPIVVERGMDVVRRQKAVDAFWQGGRLNTESNVQFGEGGAGTFSDGKLNTMVKDVCGRNRKVLQTFADFGAPGEILYMQKPHIGTDCLKEVVTAIRQEIISLGGSIWFDTRFENLITEDNKLKGIVLSQHGKRFQHKCDTLVLAMGHSARDTFYQLQKDGIAMQKKAFAVGIRIEHPQDMIGQNQYGAYYRKLPAADYKLTCQTKENRGVYSFCMCPGGYVVNASSEEGRLAVNGMSYSKREGINANSAIVVTVTPKDFPGEDALAGVACQRHLEKAAWQTAQGKIPIQLFGDFLQNRQSTSFGEIIPQTKGRYAFGNVREIFPKTIGDALAEGIVFFGHKIKGYAREDAILSGIESRTSSPVRLLRDETLQANIQGIYPCGEGAGYAGGITSAAMDGIRVAEEIKQRRQM